ncbi:MAG: iron-containing alcohol dehydrogenase family protein [Turicibacter sp.]|nr:iron-containing alcohol dehydrogenase family protein [Turicibacter sp.]
MNLFEEVRPGTNRYLSGAGILKDLPEYLAEFGTGAIITGEKSWEAFKHYYGSDLGYPVYPYDGSASDEDGQRLAQEIGDTGVILGIGGGRVLDTAKLAAQNLNRPLILIPTLVSNCAPAAPIAAVYEQQDHAFKKIEVFLQSPYITLADWDFLLATPREYLIAGIGDTLAKWYEINGITQQMPKEEMTASVMLGIASAKECLKILNADSQEALKSLEAKRVTPAFGRVSDTIMALAATVGGFAHKYGRVSGAHAVHNGLSLLSETHSVLHGDKVAYGILVQLSYNHEFEEISRLMDLYQGIGLPTRLKEINLGDAALKDLSLVAAFTAKEEESFNLIDPRVTAEKILDAMQRLEIFVASA